MASDTQASYCHDPLGSFQEIWISFIMLLWRRQPSTHIKKRSGFALESPGRVYISSTCQCGVSPCTVLSFLFYKVLKRYARVCLSVCECVHLLCWLQKAGSEFKGRERWSPKSTAAPPVGRRWCCLWCCLYQILSPYHLFNSFSLNYTLHIKDV